MFQSLARLVSTRPHLVLAIWLVLTLCAIPFASRVGEVLTAQPSDPPGSVAVAVRETIRREFADQSRYSVVMVSSSLTARVGEEAFDRVYHDVTREITALPGVAFLQDHRNTTTLPLVTNDQRTAIALIGLATDELLAAKATVKHIEQVVNSDPSLEVLLAGGPATITEVERISERDTRRSELFGLPLSLTVLLIAFGALVASGLPLLVALMSITVSFALLFAIGQVMPFAVFAQSVITMLGLATGIDYALVMVNRFREELRRHADPYRAAARTTETAGKAVAFSGLTVMIALGALLIPPLDFIRSIGFGAIIVLLASVSIALTALPAALALLGERVNWLRLTRREPGQRSRSFWRAQGERVMRDPGRWAISGALVLIALSVPALSMQVADPGIQAMTEQTASRRVQQALQQVGLEGMLRSYDVLIDFGERGFFHPQSVRAITRLSREVSALSGVETVYGPTSVGSLPSLLMQQYYASADIARQSPLAELVQATVSVDGRYALMRIFPPASTTPIEAAAIEQGLRTALSGLGLTARIGGDFIYEHETTKALYGQFPLALGLVYLATFIVLGLAFRSLLIPIKAIVLNTLTVGAAFGVLTLIFQYGLGATLLGLAGGLGFVDTAVPLFIFALVFGLSMDYEVFLVARIHEAHERGYDDKAAVISALTSTGGVISSAAAVMIAVFLPFVFSEVVLIKTLGLGLAVAIFLDATVVRLTLVPAVMALAGRWNWWLPKPFARLAERVNLSHD